MPDTEILADGRPRLSKFARKRLEQANGIRPPFQFTEGKPPPAVQEPLPLPNRPLPPPRPGRVYATVIAVATEKGCAFLMDEDGQTLYLSFNTFQRRFGDERPKKGSRFECTVDPPDPGKKYPRVTYVFTKLA